MAKSVAANSDGTAPKRKSIGRPFQKGQSGNPSGRPKLPEDVKHVREMARIFTREAVEALVAVMRSGTGPAKVAAVKEVLDRGWGKSAQPLTGEDGEGPVDHSITVKFD